MYKLQDYVVYKKDVCIVKEIRKNHINNNDYYLLVSLLDESLNTLVPVDNRCGYIRSLISKEEVEEIIKRIPRIPIIKSDSKNIENEYKILLSKCTHEDLIKIIKTTYLRNKERTDNNRKIGDKDKLYLEKAEKYLYTEFALVLGMTFDEVKEYIVDKASLMEKQNE